MGIQNLLRFLKPFMEPVHIQKYTGKRVGIDAYSWLHKGAYSCSMELCVSPESDAAKRYLKYFMHHINLLRHYKVVPVVVIDGGNIPCKFRTETERRRRRESNLVLAKERLKQGDVTSAIEFFQILRLDCVEFIVAPYEADAQLAYLSSLDPDEGGVAAVITEDSDLIAYGCPAILFKMDRYGNGEEILMDRVFNTVSEGLSFKDFNQDLFTGMCVLCGCDFLPSIPGIGTRRAYSLVSKYKNLDRVLSVLKSDKRYKVTEDYSECFWKTVAVFHHARIYDAISRTLKHLKPLEEMYLEFLNGELDLLGPDLPPSIAVAIAEGHLNPITKQAFDCFPEASICSYSDSTPSFGYTSRDESENLSAEESCVTFSSAAPSSEEKTKGKIHLDQKYMREAMALGNLAAPVKLHQVKGIDADKISVPDNNPFKKRKLGKSNSEERENGTEETVLAEVEGFVSTVCSSPESEEIVKSKTSSIVSIQIGKTQKKNKMTNKKKIQKNEKNGILKFFQRS